MLVHIESAGKHPLDVKLVGTDGESVFSVSFKHNQTFMWKDKNFAGNAEEWDTILSFMLLGTEQNDTTLSVEVAARLEAGPELKITIQRRIEEIIQKLGAITLPEKEEVVELYDWCDLTIQSKDTVERELAELKKLLKAKEAEVKKVNEGMKQMIKLKNEHENDLIEKFSLLLNEKKLKIRDQQRLLASANVDPAKAAAVERSRASTVGSAGPSHGKKRKAGQAAQEESDSDDGLEKKDVDDQRETIDSDDDPPQTPDRGSTADEESEDEAPRPLTGESNPAGKKASAEELEEESEEEALPPRRELPFSKKQPSEQAPPSKAAVAGDSETESDDDEL